MKRKISALLEHSAQKDIYPVTKESVESLAENISKCGQLEPILITPDNIIISGYTRVAALKLLGTKTVECKVLDIPEEEQVYYLISSNKQRVKDYSVRLAEADALTEYYSQGQGRRSDLDENLVLSKGTRRKSTIEKVAADLGIGKQTITQLRFIRKIHPELLPHIGKDITLASAYAQLKLYSNQKKIIADKKKRKNTKFSGTGYTIYRKPCEKMLEDLTEESIDVICTSPPYWKQRQFDDGSTELGSESSVSEYVEKMVEIVSAWQKVLKRTGSIYLNLGDTYNDGCKAQVPERVSIAIADKLGLILRNSLIWYKGAGAAPESTKTRRHTDYEMVYHFVKNRKEYYYDSDLIRVPYNTPNVIDTKPPRHFHDLNDQSKQWAKENLIPGAQPRWANISDKGVVKDVRKISNVGSSLRHPLGRIAGSLLEHSSHRRALGIDDVEHTAPFPPALVKELLLPVVREGDTVLDPFSGSGTTGVVAMEMGAEYVGFEISDAFIRLTEKRFADTVIP